MDNNLDIEWFSHYTPEKGYRAKIDSYINAIPDIISMKQNLIDEMIKLSAKFPGLNSKYEDEISKYYFQIEALNYCDHTLKEIIRLVELEEKEIQEEMIK